MRGQTATERLTRVLSIALGPTALAFGLLSLNSYLNQTQRPAITPPMVDWAVVFGIPVLLGLLANWAPLRVLRALALAEGVVFLTVLGFWLVARAMPLPAGADIPWIITLTGVPAVGIAMVVRERVAWAFTVLVCTMSGLLRAATSTDPNPVLIGIEDGLYSLLLVGLFVGLTILMRRRAVSVDAAERMARTDSIARAARVARKRERLYIDALVHDSVISTLLMAGRGGIPVATLAAHADSTLRRLDSLRGPIPDRAVPGREVTRRLEQLAAALAPDAVVRSDLPDTLAVPAIAVTALLGAVGEALRNSVRAAGVTDGTRPSGSAGTVGTAGRPVSRTVTVRATRGGILVVVRDDGVGFDPAKVPAERLGIAQSILGRMERLPGGGASVRSRPGSGTEVVVSWTPDATANPALRAGRAQPAPRLPARARPEPEPFPAGPEPVLPEPVLPEPVLPEPALPPLPGQPTRAQPFTEPIELYIGVIRLPAAMARIILVFFILVHALLAFADSEPPSTLPGEVYGFLAVSAAAAVLFLTADDRVPRGRTFAVLALSGAAAFLVSQPMRPDIATPFGRWYLGAITVLLVVLSVRGRPGSAWLGYGMIVLVEIIWALTNNLTVLDGVGLVIRHAGTLLAGTLFSVGLKRSARSLTLLHRERTVSAVSAATAVAAIEERESQLARVNLLARPTLERLAGSWELGLELRRECLHVEAVLRDAIRARALFVEPLVGAARDARERGIEVTLIDDSGDQPPARIDAVASAVAGQLRALAVGRLTARVLPPDRDIIASIVIEAGAHRMLVVTPDGLLREV